MKFLNLILVIYDRARSYHLMFPAHIYKEISALGYCIWRSLHTYVYYISIHIYTYDGEPTRMKRRADGGDPPPPPPPPPPRKATPVGPLPALLLASLRPIPPLRFLANLTLLELCERIRNIHWCLCTYAYFQPCASLCKYLSSYTTFHVRMYVIVHDWCRNGMKKGALREKYT